MRAPRAKRPLNPRNASPALKYAGTLQRLEAAAARLALAATANSPAAPLSAGTALHRRAARGSARPCPPLPPRAPTPRRDAAHAANAAGRELPLPVGASAKRGPAGGESEHREHREHSELLVPPTSSLFKDKLGTSTQLRAALQ